MLVTRRHKAFTMTVLALALAACQTGAPTSGPAPEAEQNLSLGKNLGSQQTGKAGAAGGTQVETAADGESTGVEKLPSREETLAAAQAMAVTASAGGLYKSADGALEATIPPGALTGDAEVKFGRVDTKGFNPNPLFVPGVMFAMDLGGAQLKPGSAIMVKTVVDQRFVDELVKQGQDLAARGVSQGVDGNWYLTMPVKNLSGEDAEQMQTTQLNDDISMVELMPTNMGGRSVMATADETASATPTPAPTPTPEPTLTPSNTDDPVVNGYPAMPVAKAGQFQKITHMKVTALGYATTLTVGDSVAATMAGGSIPEYLHCFIAHGWCSNDAVTGAISDVIRYNKAIAANRLPPDSLVDRVKGFQNWDCTTGANRLTDVSLKAEYVDENGNEPAVKPTKVTFVVNANGNVLNHATDGHAVSFKAGLDRQLRVYGYVTTPTLPVYSQSTPQSLVTSDGLGDITCKIPRHNPKITLTLNSEAVLPSELALKYTIGGQSGAATLDLAGKGAGGRNAVVSFYAQAPGVEKHDFTIDSLTGGDVTKDPAQKVSFKAWINGEHAATVKIIGLAGK